MEITEAEGAVNDRLSRLIVVAGRFMDQGEVKASLLAARWSKSDIIDATPGAGLTDNAP